MEQKIIDFAWNYGPKTLMAIVIFFGGLWIIKKVSHGFDSVLKQRKVDESLRPFFASMVDVGMKVVLLLVVANTFGLETTSFIAVFSAIAFSVGLALQGSLGNFASGVLILLFRPYKVGDLLTFDGKMGVVSAIQIFSTVISTAQNTKIIIPNGKITEGAIESIPMEGEVRSDVVVAVKDDTSINLMRSVALEVARHCPYALEGKLPFVQISGFPQDSMKVEIGVWTTGTHYWDTFYYMNEALKNGFDEVGIEMAKEDEKSR